MILDLTARQALLGLPAAAAPAREWLELESRDQGWRHLLLADRAPAGDPLAQAEALAKAHLAGEALALLPLPWSPAAFRALPLPEWRRRAEQALANGLAYASHTAPLDPAGAAERAVLALVGGVAALFERPAGRCNWQGSGWQPVTAHTFDFAAVLYDPALLALLLVADED